MAMSDDTTEILISFRIPWHGRLLLRMANGCIWMAKRLTLFAAHTAVVRDK